MYKTSSFCRQGSCVEVMVTEAGVLVKEGKETGTPPMPLVFTHDEWRDFIKGVKAGEFDLPA